MKTFAVQRTLTGITMDQLAAAQQAAIQASQELSNQGTPVSYVRSNFYPADQRCTCLFQAHTQDAVEIANKKAELPFDKVEEVLDLCPSRG